MNNTQNHVLPLLGNNVYPTYKNRARNIRDKYVNIMGDYSSNRVSRAIVAKNLDPGWLNMSDILKRRIEKWYFSIPKSTMQDTFKPQPLEFLNDKNYFNRKKNEFSMFVDAVFKGGVIDRPLLDPIRPPSTPQQYAKAKEDKKDM